MVEDSSSSSDHNNNHFPKLFPILYENDEEMLQSRTVREIQIASNFAVLKSSSKSRRSSRSSNDDDTADTTTTSISNSKRYKKDITNNTTMVDPKEYQLAIETAILVQKEIEQWEKSIAELEQLLHQQEGQQQSSSTSSSSSSSPTLDSSSTIVVEEQGSDRDKVIGNVVEKEMNIPIVIPHLASPSNEARAVVIDHIND
jgi:hypothetical protein